MQWFLGLETWQRAVLVSLLLYSATALGASLVFFSKKFRSGAFTLLLGLSAGIMVAASFFSLLLPALSYDSGVPSYLAVGIGFALGGIFIILSDMIFRKKKKEPPAEHKNRLLFLAVTLHNIPEGMAVGVALAAAGSEAGAAFSAFVFAVGIAVQNFPEGACVAFPLRASGMSPCKSFLFSQGSGAVEIPACILGALAAAAAGWVLPWALSFSAGAMIAVVCAELIPECYEGNKTLATLGVVAGFVIMMILDVALG